MNDYENIDIKYLGEVCRRVRKEMGLRQVDLAKRAGVGVRFLSELERGKQTLEVGKVFQVVRSIGLNLVIESAKFSTSNSCKNVDENSLNI